MDASDTQSPAIEDQPVVSVRAAAELLGVTPQTIRNWVSEGVLEGHIESGGQRQRWSVSLVSVQQAAARQASARSQGGTSRGRLPVGLDAHVVAEADASRLRAELAETHQALERALEQISSLQAVIALRAESHERLQAALVKEREVADDLLKASAAERGATDQFLYPARQPPP
jgi:hypothetical protein